jgi:hypothetical protein
MRACAVGGPMGGGRGAPYAFVHVSVCVGPLGGFALREGDLSPLIYRIAAALSKMPFSNNRTNS